MFDHSSRYYAIPTAQLVLPDGREVSYARRRFPPRTSDAPLLAEVIVTTGDRIDHIANRIYGDPLAFWRLCDANGAVDPLEMLRDAAEDPARRLRAPTPQL